MNQHLRNQKESDGDLRWVSISHILEWLAQSMKFQAHSAKLFLWQVKTDRHWCRDRGCVSSTHAHLVIHWHTYALTIPVSAVHPIGWCHIRPARDSVRSVDTSIRSYNQPTYRFTADEDRSTQRGGYWDRHPLSYIMFICLLFNCLFLLCNRYSMCKYRQTS